MKKPLIILLVLLAVGLASFLWIRSQMGVGDPARLLPADAVGYLAVTDLPRSAMRWPKTALAGIAAEPEMKAFMEKPLAYLNRDQGGDEAISILLGLKPARLYTGALPSAGGQPATVVGFQYWGSQAEFDKAISRLRVQVGGKDSPEPSRETHAGAEILSTPLPGGGVLYSATGNRWGFLANDRDAIVGSLDRAAGRSAEPSLADDAAFTSVLARLPAAPDVMGFLRTGPVLDSLLAVGTAMGATPDKSQLEQLRKAEAVGFALKIDGADLRDAIFILRPDPPDIGSLTHAGIPFTAPETLAYFEFLFRLESLSALALTPQLNAAIPPPPPEIQSALENLPKALGNEVSLAVDWPMDGIRPRVVVSIPVKDQELASNLLMQFSSLLPETTLSAADGVQYYGFPSLRSAFLNPTVAIGTGFLVAGMDVPDVEEALARQKIPETLEAAPAFAPALPVFRAANETFGYIDTKAVFERAFGALRPVIVFGAALMPGVDEIVDASKLPETETIAKHLTPIVVSQSRLADGYLIESSGPVTMLQVTAAAAGGGSIFLGPQVPWR